MENEFLREMFKAGNTTWSYAFAFGWLAQEARQFLRADQPRERFTAQFALVDTAHSIWVKSIGGSDTEVLAWAALRDSHMRVAGD